MTVSQRLILSLCAACLLPWAVQAQPTQVVVVRHAEKSGLPADDPDLSPEGQARAQALARLLQPADVSTIIVTSYRRTQQTAAPLASHIPLAALSAILMFVAWNMGEWREFVHLRQFRLPYRVTLLAVFLLTVIVDLTVAVEVGLIAACLTFIYRISNLTRSEAVTPQTHPILQGQAPGVKAYRLYGALFFGAVKLIEANKRVAMGVGVGVGKSLAGLGAFADLHSVSRYLHALFSQGQVVGWLTL